MTVTFVTRHPGAIDWMRQEGLLPDEARIVEDFDEKDIVAGDLVIGTLPAQLAAAICERGARYQHLTLDLAPDQRGRELSADDMRACNARLEEFFIQRRTVSPQQTPTKKQRVAPQKSRPGTLITFLGKGKTGGGYHRTTYRFPDGQQETTAFFGISAAEVTGADTIRIFGTAGSMWDVFFLDHAPTDGHDTLWDSIADAVSRDGVSAEQLAALEALLNRQGTRRYELRLIPYGHDDAEQTAILRAVAGGIDRTQSIYLDLTHGLRHLPMLGLLAAFYLRAATGTRIDGIYYGAFERSENNVTPVLRLDGLLSLYDWIRALEQFNKDGDYSSFSELFDSEGLPGALLREAAFLERIANASQGSQKLGTAMQKINQATTISPAAEMFLPLLQHRTAWRKGRDRAAREKALAADYLERRDYLRATQFGFEAHVTAQVWENRGNPNEYSDRETAEESLYGKGAGQPTEQPGNFKTLKNLRNALAHGVVDATRGGAFNQFIQKLTSDEDLLRAWLNKTLT